MAGRKSPVPLGAIGGSPTALERSHVEENEPVTSQAEVTPKGRQGGAASTTSVSQTKLEDIRFKREKLDIDQTFEDAQARLQDQIDDCEIDLQYEQDQRKLLAYQAKMEGLKRKMVRCQRDWDRALRHLQARQDLLKEEKAAYQEEEQNLGSDEEVFFNAAERDEEGNQEKEFEMDPTATSFVPKENPDCDQTKKGTEAKEKAEDPLEVIARTFKETLLAVKGDKEWEPKDLPKFYGKAEDWPIFHNEFVRTTPEGKVNTSQNAIRLRKALGGSARDAVLGLLDEPLNVSRVITMLHERFGRNDLVIQSLIQKAESCKPPDPNKPQSFVDYATAVIHLVERVRSLREHQYLRDHGLLRKLTEKLPTIYAREWLHYSRTSVNSMDLSDYCDWLEAELKIQVQLVTPNAVDDDREHKDKKKPTRGSAKAAPASSESGSFSKKTCGYCNKEGHEISKCYSFKKSSLEEKKEIVKEKNLCFRCLEKGHKLSDCDSKKPCGKDGCKAKHHPLLHSEKREKTPEPEEMEVEPPPAPLNNATPTSCGAFKASCSKPLSIVRGKIKGPLGSRRVAMLLDSGADTTIINSALAAQLGIRGPRMKQTVRGICGNTVKEDSEVISFEVSGAFKNAKFYKVEQAITLTDLGLSPYTQDAAAVKLQWPYLKKAKLDSFQQVTPLIIIGEDHPYLTAHREIIQNGESNPMAKRTVLGWVLGGRKISEMARSAKCNVLQMSEGDRLDDLLKMSFSLDAYGVYPDSSSASVEDKKALEILKATVKKVGDQWEAGLLWRDPTARLPDSRSDAMRRLLSNEKRMKKDESFRELYHRNMEDHIRKGYVTELTDEQAKTVTPRTYYFAHFGVTNVNKPGKLRVVFDAAAKHDGVCLNDFLLEGPNLIRPLTAVIMNFRTHNIALNGDIEEMFHRVLVRQEDRECQRFLWRDFNDKQEKVRTFQMNVLIFGASSSPSTAIFVKNLNAEQFRDVYPDAVNAVTSDFYCDDVLTGARTVEEAIQLRKQLQEINQNGNFVLKKWLSNSKEVLESIPEEDRAASVKSFGEKSSMPLERILGLWWNPDRDEFTFTANLKKVDPELLAGRRPTKRDICSLIMSVFDPLGMIANFKIRGLILLQRVWRSETDWDDFIPASIYEDWKDWVGELKNVENVKVPRLYARDIHLATDVQLHAFADASEEACSSVCFLRVKIGEIVNVSFICAKTKVAPVRKLTIPRLELVAATMAAGLADTVIAELRVPINSKVLWSDSKTVLAWIRTEKLRLKEFVANRINRIHMLTNVREWRWIPSALNVADDGTKLSTKVILSPDSTWLTGPLFLQREEVDWPKEKKASDVVADGDAAQELKKCYTAEVMVAATRVVKESTVPTVKMENFSSYNRMVRAQAGFKAAVKNWMDRRCEQPDESPWRKVNGKITSSVKPEDFASAEDDLLRKVQEDAFGEDLQAIKGGKFGKKNALWKLTPVLVNGLLRVRGRIGLAEASEEVKNPIILPGKHIFTELIVMREHVRNGHQGQATILNNLRSRFWIIGGKAAVKRAQRNCFVCKFWTAKPFIPKMGDLPSYRLSHGNPPFTFTGADLFGPLEVAVGRRREKRWVLLLTCMVTRAIHLEVVHALSTDETMMALSRFMDQRGRVRHFYSDNGGNFHGAAKELKKSWSEIDWDAISNVDKFMEIGWHFNPPYSPHHGGAWERLIGEVKKVLKLTLKDSVPRDQVLLTKLKGAENIVNSRPLTNATDDPSDLGPLTPNHFLRGFSDLGPTLPGQFEKNDERSRALWRRAQYFIDQFWSRWTTEALPRLLKKEKWHADSEPIQVGDLVLLVDEELKLRNEWKRGVITDVFPGKDGIVRVVNVKTVHDKTGTKISTKIYRRGVEKVVPLGLKMLKSG